MSFGALQCFSPGHVLRLSWFRKGVNAKHDDMSDVFFLQIHDLFGVVVAAVECCWCWLWWLWSNKSFFVGDAVILLLLYTFYHDACLNVNCSCVDF